MSKEVKALEFDQDTKNLWWVLVLTGVLSVIFGFVAIIWPQITIGVLALLFAVFIGVNGVVDVVQGVKKLGKSVFAGLLNLLIGFLAIGVSVFLLANVGSGFAIATLVLVISLSFIVRGVLVMVLAFSEPDLHSSRWFGFFVGMLSVLAGLVIAWYPQAGTLAWVWVVGLFALIAGAMQIAVGLTAKDQK
ncbi:MAG: DUF308 domain-containing protein [Patescibacteria group bacterium]|jgi:uncharacterized membrane protein HdeD (DUF308 family)|nr:DUF308 domain-containing protein [Patescibacteria group bacterium]